MKRSTHALTAALLVAASLVISAQNTPGGPSLGIDVAGMDRTVRPQDDFFRFVNGAWADRTQIPADMTNWGTFAKLRDEASVAVRGLIEEAGASPSEPGSVKAKIGAYYRSFMDEARIEALGVQPLAAELSAIAAVKKADDLPAAFIRAAQIGVRVPFAVTVGQDPKQSAVYIVLVNQSGLGMPDRDYYWRKDEKFAGIRDAYVRYITSLLTLAGQPDPRGAAERILALETELAGRQWDRARSRDRDATYNKMAVAVLQAGTPHFNWQSYFNEAIAAGAALDAANGVKDPVRRQVTEVVVRQPDYVRAVGDMLGGTPIGVWKEYLTFGTISAYAAYLPAVFADAQFRFNGGVIGGREQDAPRWKRGVSAVEDALGEAVGRLYIDKYFKPEAKARMDALVRNLLAAFKSGIDELEWMSPATRAQAQAKLAKYTMKIGYPDKWRDYTALEVSGDDLVGNVMRSRRFQSADVWARLGKPVERWRWGFTPQTVNASYSASNNEITFPAGILQPPFFDVDADDAVNYGAIGSVIGHEISHGFDDQGRKSDGDGNLRDWWTAADVKAFEARASRLGAQFESYAPLPDLKINGRQTMGENIGDLSGIAVAYRAYKISLDGKQPPVIDGFTGDQRFFLGYGQVWRFKSRDEALRNQLLTDSHSPGMFRAFVPLTNIDAFYEAFNLRPGDKLYRPPNERVKIW
ncbi:MAG TPA: M13 family metallopeptidase [Vicinamibacterales bacterium]|nr:M13 family metallopeptidase [Vicinamibacterales bacterium]